MRSCAHARSVHTVAHARRPLNTFETISPIISRRGITRIKYRRFAFTIEMISVSIKLDTRARRKNGITREKIHFDLYKTRSWKLCFISILCQYASCNVCSLWAVTNIGISANVSASPDYAARVLPFPCVSWGTLFSPFSAKISRYFLQFSAHVITNSIPLLSENKASYGNTTNCSSRTIRIGMRCDQRKHILHKHTLASCFCIQGVSEIQPTNFQAKVYRRIFKEHAYAVAI